MLLAGHILFIKVSDKPGLFFDREFMAETGTPEPFTNNVKCKRMSKIFKE